MSVIRLNNQQLQAIVNNLTVRAPKTTYSIDGKTYNASSIVKLAQSVLKARAATAAAKGEWKSTRSAGQQVEAAVVPIAVAVRGILVPALRNDEAAMADLALSPRKAARTLSVEEKLTARQKALATRQARGTMGKQQKARVKGNVTGIVVTNVTAPVASPSPTTSPPAQAAGSDVATPAPAAPAAAPITTPQLAAVTGPAPAVTTPTTPSVAAVEPVALVAPSH